MAKPSDASNDRLNLRLAAAQFDESAGVRERLELDACLAVLHRFDDATYRSAGLIDLKNVLPPTFHRAFEGDVDTLWLLRRRRGRVLHWIPTLEEHRYIAAAREAAVYVLGRSASADDAASFEELADHLAKTLGVPLRRSTRVEPIKVDWTVAEHKLRLFFWLSFLGILVSPVSAIPTVAMIALPLVLAQRWARAAKILSTEDTVHPWDKVQDLTRAASRVAIVAAVSGGLSAAVASLMVLLALRAFLDGFAWGHFNGFAIGVSIWMAIIPTLMAVRAFQILRLLRAAIVSSAAQET
jgi:hypothetical protein